MHIFRVEFKVKNRKFKDLEKKKKHVLNRAVVLINVWINVTEVGTSKRLAYKFPIPKRQLQMQT